MLGCGKAIHFPSRKTCRPGKPSCSKIRKSIAKRQKRVLFSSCKKLRLETSEDDLSTQMWLSKSSLSLGLIMRFNFQSPCEFISFKTRDLWKAVRKNSTISENVE